MARLPHPRWPAGAVPPAKTLRDEFAMAALAGLIAQCPCKQSAQEFARQAFACADAMMTERTKGGQP